MYPLYRIIQLVAEAGFEPLKLRPLGYEPSEHSELLYSASADTKNRTWIHPV